MQFTVLSAEHPFLRNCFLPPSSWLLQERGGGDKTSQVSMGETDLSQGGHWTQPGCGCETEWAESMLAAAGRGNPPPRSENVPGLLGLGTARAPPERKGSSSAPTEC